MASPTALKTLYRGIRRLNVFDLTWLLAASAEQIGQANPFRSGDVDQAEDWRRKGQITPIDALYLERLHREEKIHPQAGHYPTRSLPPDFQSGCSCHRLRGVEDPQRGERILVGLWTENRMVSFVWVAMAYVPGEENFSRSQHLGTSLRLPPGVGFLSNAWTDPDYRGRGCLAALLSRIAEPDFWARPAMSHWTCAIDWTNESSLQGFRKAGFQPIGRIWRFGRGRWQWSLLPDIGRWWREESSRQPATDRCVQSNCVSAVPTLAPDVPGWQFPVSS